MNKHNKKSRLQIQLNSKSKLTVHWLSFKSVPLQDNYMQIYSQLLVTKPRLVNYVNELDRELPTLCCYAVYPLDLWECLNRVLTLRTIRAGSVFRSKP